MSMLVEDITNEMETNLSLMILSLTSEEVVSVHNQWKDERECLIHLLRTGVLE
jgi:hypothetical protein